MIHFSQWRGERANLATPSLLPSRKKGVANGKRLSKAGPLNIGYINLTRAWSGWWLPIRTSGRPISSAAPAITIRMQRAIRRRMRDNDRRLGNGCTADQSFSNHPKWNGCILPPLRRPARSDEPDAIFAGQSSEEYEVFHMQLAVSLTRTTGTTSGLERYRCRRLQITVKPPA
jgi:hypothetical protein